MPELLAACATTVQRAAGHKGSVDRLENGTSPARGSLRFTRDMIVLTASSEGCAILVALALVPWAPSATLTPDLATIEFRKVQLKLQRNGERALLAHLIEIGTAVVVFFAMRTALALVFGVEVDGTAVGSARPFVTRNRTSSSTSAFDRDVFGFDAYGRASVITLPSHVVTDVFMSVSMPSTLLVVAAPVDSAQTSCRWRERQTPCAARRVRASRWLRILFNARMKLSCNGTILIIGEDNLS